MLEPRCESITDGLRPLGRQILINMCNAVGSDREREKKKNCPIHHTHSSTTSHTHTLRRIGSQKTKCVDSAVNLHPEILTVRISIQKPARRLEPHVITSSAILVPLPGASPPLLVCRQWSAPDSNQR